MIKRCGWIVLRLTTRPRPAWYGWTCQELPPTGIARGHKGTQASLPRQGNSPQGSLQLNNLVKNIFHIYNNANDLYMSNMLRSRH